ncbi:MAG: hypothetical protein HYS74_00100 [Parcubacteria group bacterium]|nr:hypothetical protein [Parcubacteria group bacterium]
MVHDAFFSSPAAQPLSFDDMIEGIVAFIAREPNRRYKVVVGSDSSARGMTSVITAVLVWRIGNGGTYFFHRTRPTVYHTQRDRIIAETMNSIMLAQEIRSRLVDRLGNNFLWDGSEIHADIGENGDTKKFIKEVTGLIRGVDFVPVIKPYAWCASTVADRHTG